MAKLTKEEKDLLKEKAKLKAVNAKQAIVRKKMKKEPYYITPEPTGDVEVDSKNDLTELQASFRKRMQAENNRLDLTTDSEYWVALCFTAREQKEEFLRKLNLIQFGDKYLDGERVAKELGVELEEVEMKYQISDKIDKDYQKLAM